MQKQFSDEQIDRIMARLTRPDDESVDQIANSPQLWWSVQSNIAREKEAKVSPWPPVEKIWRWLAISAPVTAGVIVAAVWLASGLRTERPSAFQEQVELGTPPTVVVGSPDRAELPDRDEGSKDVVHRAVAPIKASRRSRGSQKSVSTTVARLASRKSVEIKTDFIALTYAQAPTSGQIVRVKVPSAMMVSLGLVGTVEKPAQLVDAEVILGDTGMTHAIRFIRNQ